MRLADLPCLVDLVFVGNPLQERHVSEGNWMEEACKKLPHLKKLDGEIVKLLFILKIMKRVAKVCVFCFSDVNF